ncbi:MAG: hypothetical protein ACOX7H_02255 [Bacillota bacterium]|jgi:exopolyphosphatase/guanosine-5'-triphosphate,3'-diphosphate pyrophosphatase
MHYGILDIGSNSVTLVIYKKKKNKLAAIFNEKRDIVLIDHLKDGALSQEGCHQLLDTLDQFNNIAKVFRVDKFLPFATTVLSCAANCEDVLLQIHQELGLNIEIINGKDEAYYDYVGVEASGFVSGKSGYILDIDSCSSIIVNFQRGDFQESVNLPFGSLSLTRQFFQQELPSQQKLQDILLFVKQQIEESHIEIQGKKTLLIGVGSSARMLSRIDRNQKCLKDLSHAYELSFKEVENIYNLVLDNPMQAQDSFFKVCINRTPTILPGIVAFYQMSNFLKADKIIISRFGVREGYLITKLLRTGDGEKCMMMPPDTVL